MHGPAKELNRALEILELPAFVTKEDIKKQYHFLAKKHHPDLGGETQKMEEINYAYKLLMKYIEEFRYTFDENEINRQYPGADYVQRFRV
jgi:DnaJ-class molecular chaperone